jgi:Response regulator with putative antiterminator output domain
MDTLRFAIGDEDKPGIVTIRNILLSAGHMVVCEEYDGSSLLRSVRSLLPDFVISGYNLPGIRGPEIARIIEGDRIAPVLLVADSSKDIFVRKMGNENFPYIIKPVSEGQLLGTIDFVYNNYKRLTSLELEVNELKNMLEIRKLVEKAKGILMDKYNMKEKDAFRYIQKRSMDECKAVVEIAKRIIENAK